MIIHGAGAQSDVIVEHTEEGSIKVQKVIDRMNRPWSLAFLPGDEGILITERPGYLNLLNRGRLSRISGLPDITPSGQGGLLDVIADRNFVENRTIYFSYSRASWGRYGTAVAKGELRGLNLENVKIIFEADPKSRGGQHFGSRLLLTDDNHLYITLGDRGRMDNAQDLDNHAGSVVRINTDGSIPQDNPYVGSNAGKPEIYSYGHRNPQGIAYNSERDEIWLHEHGPKGGDEVNIVRKGANYGWPVITYGINYNGSVISNETSRPGMEQPVVYWDPSIAPSGMAFVQGDGAGEWAGNLFVGALAGQHLRRLVLQEDEVVHQEVLLKNKIGRIRDVRTGPDGYLYVLTDSDNGVLYRIKPPAGN